METARQGMYSSVVQFRDGTLGVQWDDAHNGARRQGPTLTPPHAYGRTELEPWTFATALCCCVLPLLALHLPTCFFCWLAVTGWAAQGRSATQGWQTNRSCGCG